MTAHRYILSIAFNFHDSSVSISKDETVILVLEAERLFRIKKYRCSASSMQTLIRTALVSVDLTPDDISLWVLGTLNNPWLDDKRHFTELYRFERVSLFGKSRSALIVNHHVAHAAAYFFSDYSQARISTCDGGGDNDQRVGLFQGFGNTIHPIKANPDDFITSSFYGQCTRFLYKGLWNEGKMMALAGFGTASPTMYERLDSLARGLCYGSLDDGQAQLRRAFPELEGAALNEPLTAADFCTTVQQYFTDRRVEELSRFISNAKDTHLILGGGGALNVTTNSAISTHVSSEIFALPCCDDSGISLGGLALAIVLTTNQRPKAALPYLGQNAPQRSRIGPTTSQVADWLSSGDIVLNYAGCAEVGPRALGNRSFLATPLKPEIAVILSTQVKGREQYRPLAPVVREEDFSEFFCGKQSALSRFMLQSYQVKHEARALLSSVTHRDGTARVQTVSRSGNAPLWRLLTEFRIKTGVGVLINTSLNDRDVPLANTTADVDRLSRQIAVPHRIVINNFYDT
jgi:carbamoyltransferase